MRSILNSVSSILGRLPRLGTAPQEEQADQPGFSPCSPANAAPWVPELVAIPDPDAFPERIRLATEEKLQYVFQDPVWLHLALLDFPGCPAKARKDAARKHAGLGKIGGILFLKAAAQLGEWAAYRGGKVYHDVAENAYRNHYFHLIGAVYLDSKHVAEAELVMGSLGLITWPTGAGPFTEIVERSSS
ncbi:hypothetical protein B0O99DRAFT_630601 [Bisporella sp. PMI_857]|nr:hypothetical protein B0O99DRAFT_630601 [Bisporella sp. PMI_857]